MPPLPPAEERGRTRERKLKKNFKKNRWGVAPPTFFSGLGALPKFIPGTLSMEQIAALLIRVRMEEITKKLNANELDLDNNGEERSPSPEPIYDLAGKRINTREQRARDILNYERQKLVEEALKFYPQFKPPADFTPVNTKKTKKIFIPVEKNPEYNFIGLIIGPRGNTQKRMEKETGCKIVIRGKGSVIEGKQRKDGYRDSGEDDALHVLITADTEDQLNKATKMIRELLIPVEEGKNEHKRQQLRELAVINGTLRDNSWMQPVTFESSFEPANVKCAICGEVSHPTSDCPLRGNSILPGQAALASEMDKFLSEIGEAPPPSQPMAPKPSDADPYAEFMASLSEATGGDPSNTAPWAQQGYQGYVPQGMPGMPQQVPWGQGTGAPGVPPPWAQPQGMPWGAPVQQGVPPPVPFGAPPGMQGVVPPWAQQPPQ